MKKDKLQPQAKSIDQFEFHVSPLDITFKRNQNESFYVYVQKGAQVLGKVDQAIRPTHSHYQFSAQHTKKFRAASSKNLAYQWSLYRLTSDEQQEYVQSAGFSIRQHFEQYTQQFIKIQSDLHRIYYEKQKEKKCELEEIWKDLRHDLRSEGEMQCEFGRMGVRLRFTVRVRCEYDVRWERWEKQKERRRLEKKSSINRKGSTESRNSVVIALSEQSERSLVQYRQKGLEPHFTAPEHKNASQQSLSTDTRRIQQHNGLQQQQTLRQSQIRITNPQGIDVTPDTPQKFLTHRKAIQQDFYYRKKTSMLSDIIEQSYQGSSNVNLTKSNQGQKLKSVDIIQQQEEPMFSPMIKTQTFESEKHEEYFSEIKRTATLAHKTSEEFELEEKPTGGGRKSYCQDKQKPEARKRLFGGQEGKETTAENQDLKTSILHSSKTESELDNEVIEDFGEAKKLIIKNGLKIFFIVVLLVLAVNLVSVFGGRELKDGDYGKGSKERGGREERIHKITRKKATKDRS